MKSLETMQKAVEAARAERVHRVDDRRGVGGVFPGGVSELLDRLGEQVILPAFEVGARRRV
ncbi:hypothetical protein G3I59_01490 [Amycolatopsis rubida]|uniref:Uncharacterized protein n=1 Tax=Amycolatopsis rubida TaxID=112413 RepID=A0ABX0BLG8_9PSEU|nr:MULTISPECIES: hypothetical protein [Amycolatopsis]MYW89340.1 hypothetical protein [Amycolatopsis rubida]NEC54318.1 hypothetical protein [Amycolatopsis rubida]